MNFKTITNKTVDITTKLIYQLTIRTNTLMTIKTIIMAMEIMKDKSISIRTLSREEITLMKRFLPCKTD
jgi:hypothetical protein